jgi:membrane protease YdiL (CAAX protease family)
MDRVRTRAFLITVAALIGLECGAAFLYPQPWTRGFTPLGWTGLIRGADILLFFILFRIFSVPVSEAGLKRFTRGTIVGFLASLVLGAGFFLLLHLIRSLWGVDLRGFVSPGTKILGLAPLAVLCVLGPFAEEIFFRGLCYTVIRAYRGVWVSVSLSACIFAASHLLTTGSPAAIVVPLIGGTVLALLYEYTGSLLASFILHGVANFILFSGIP